MALASLIIPALATGGVLLLGAEGVIHIIEPLFRKEKPMISQEDQDVVAAVQALATDRDNARQSLAQAQTEAQTAKDAQASAEGQVVQLQGDLLAAQQAKADAEAKLAQAAQGHEETLAAMRSAMGLPQPPQAEQPALAGDGSGAQ